MKPELFRKLNLAFTIDHCPRCRILCEFIERINQKLPINERIRIVNCTYYQKYGIIDNPLIQLYSKSFEGYPTIFLKNGIKIDGANTRIESEIFLKTILQDMYIIGEDNEFIFDKECSYKDKGLFKNKVVCKN
jgi:hypothetical protein